MFLSLTSAGDTKPVYLRVETIEVVEAVDWQTTSVFLRSGREVLVRETPRRVLEAIAVLEGCVSLRLPSAVGQTME